MTAQEAQPDAGSRAPQRVEFATTDIMEAKDVLDKTYGWRFVVERPARAGKALKIFMTQARDITLAPGRRRR